MMAGHNEAFFLAAMQIKSKNGTVQSNGGEEKYFFTFKGRKQLMEPCTHQNTDRCGSSSKPCSGSLHCPQSPAAMHIYTAPCRSLPMEKKNTHMATYSSFMMGVHNSIYKNYLFHINTCIWTHKLWICSRYHRCLRHRIFFLSRPRLSRAITPATAWYDRQVVATLLPQLGCGRWQRGLQIARSLRR